MSLDDPLLETVRRHNMTQFWDWFAANCEQIKTAYETDNVRWIHTNLSPRLKKIHSALNWEIGPYYQPEQTLVISPTIWENLPLADRVVAAAPVVLGWRFLSAKPPKEMKHLAMTLPGKTGAEVCGDSWVYRLTAYNQKEFFDVDVFVDNAEGVADDDLRLMTCLLIESLLGERLYLERIAAVKVFRENDQQSRENLNPFPLLGRHMGHLLEST
jgi:hypothetical protein